MRPLPRRPVLGPAEVRALLPHRPPLVLVDRVVGFRADPDPALLAERDLDPDDPVFAAHFPGHPIWPGALIIEGLAQAAQLLLVLRAGAGGGVALGGAALVEGVPVGGVAVAAGAPLPPGIGVLTDVAVRLLRPVLPGQTLTYRVDLAGAFGAGFRMLVEARVGRTPVAEGTISVAILPASATLPPGGAA
ncbi:MAG: hypothetical protein Q8P41_15920 [Pseudomonadota bacterium]|nr:hypothetical protein [Pseudomonadota bacterium]